MTEYREQFGASAQQQVGIEGVPARLQIRNTAGAWSIVGGGRHEDRRRSYMRSLRKTCGSTSTRTSRTSSSRANFRFLLRGRISSAAFRQPRHPPSSWTYSRRNFAKPPAFAIGGDRDRRR